MKIYTVEDDEEIRELIVYALISSGFDVKGFEKSSEFFAEMKQSLPDIVLLDVMLPEESGISILKKLKSEKTTKKIPVIMITAKSSELDKIRGLDSGADDYVTKPFSVLELVSRIKAVLRRTDNTVAEDNNIFKIENLLVDCSKYLVTSNDKEIILTRKEFELLTYLLINKGYVKSRDAIMEKVWGFDYEGESRTVDMHIKTLRKKLKESGEMIKTVRGIGYKIDG